MIKWFSNQKKNNNNTKNNISIVNYTLTCFVDIDEILKLSPKTSDLTMKVIRLEW